MNKISAIAMTLTCLTTGQAWAQSSDWTGEASLTGSKTTGNTETTDLGLGLKVQKDGDLWRHKFQAQADYGESEDVKNKQRFALGYQIDRDISERLYAFGKADYYNDDFGAYEEGYFLGTGLGYQLVLPDPVGWNVEAGLGYRSQSTQGPLSVTENELAARLFSDFDYQLNDNVSLYNDTELTYASSDTYIWNEIGVTAQLFGNLAGRASFRVDHHTDVPLGREKTDTISRVGVVYTMN